MGSQCELRQASTFMFQAVILHKGRFFPNPWFSPGKTSSTIADGGDSLCRVYDDSDPAWPNYPPDETCPDAAVW